MTEQEYINAFQLAEVTDALLIIRNLTPFDGGIVTNEGKHQIERILVDWQNQLHESGN